jgi:exosortase
MYVAGAIWYLPALEGWSLPAMVAGAVWSLGGKAVLRWSLPAIAFLAFMLPLPYRVERSLSLPLQHVATRASCWLLECLGEPAISEGNVIVMHDARLLVAEACSGMRIFVSVFALAYAYAVLLDRRWWCKLLTLASVPPIAIAVNALRITVTGLLSAHLTTESAHQFAHDFSGWAMLPVAAGMLAAVPWYLGRLIIEVETASPPELLSKSSAATGRAP